MGRTIKNPKGLDNDILVISIDLQSMDYYSFTGVALSILEDLAVRKRSGAAIVAQNCRANAATIGVVLSHKRHTTQNNNRIRKGTARECTPDQTMLQRESQRPFAQQQRPKEEERTSKGQRIIRANHQASHIKVLSNFPDTSVTLQTHPDPSPTQRSSPKQAHWYMCRLTHSAIPSQLLPP